MKLTDTVKGLKVDTRLIIDGDIPVFAATAAAQEEFTFDNEQYVVSTNMSDALATLAGYIESLAELTGITADRMVFCFSSRDNFRKGIYAPYKCNRKGMKPAGFRKCIEWVKENFESVEYAYLEGDDVCGLISRPHDIIVSSDKDLLTVPGIHMNPDTHLVTQVDRKMAYYQHALQTLTGDQTDNYPGCPGIGPVRAARILDGLAPEEYWDTILAAYDAKEQTPEFALQNARCAYILHEPDDYNPETETYRLWTPTKWNESN